MSTQHDFSYAQLHPDKTRFVDFRSYRPDGKDHSDTDGTTFTLLDFCHVWGKSRKGENVVRQVTSRRSSRWTRECSKITDPASAQGGVRRAVSLDKTISDETRSPSRVMFDAECPEPSISGTLRCEARSS